MTWRLEDTGRVSGWDPYDAIALDAIYPFTKALRRVMRVEEIDITRLVAGDPLYWLIFQTHYWIWEAVHQWVYWDTRLTWALRLWISRRHTARMATVEDIHQRGLDSRRKG